MIFLNRILDAHRFMLTLDTLFQLGIHVMYAMFLAKERRFPKCVKTFYVCRNGNMKAKLYDFGPHKHKDEYKIPGIGI